MKIHLYILLSAVLFCACSDETAVTGSKEGVISITGVISRSLDDDLTLPGSAKDYEVSTLRVMAFDKNDDNKCKSNIKYSDVEITETILHPIPIGTYTFIFLANEPNTSTAELEAVSIYTDLNNIAFPTDAITSDRPIPMMQEADVEVLANGSAIYNGAIVSEVEVYLTRLGVRVDVILRSEENLDDLFKGVTFSNIPNEVPLMYDNYEGNRHVEYSLLNNIEHIESIDDMVWAKKINRVILPANMFSDSWNSNKAIRFNIHLANEEHLFCELKISSDPENYTLPKNARLQLIVTIKKAEVAVVHMTVLPWIDSYEYAELIGGKSKEIQTLNVSHTIASVTYKGKTIRIFFSSNMYNVLVSYMLTKSDGNMLYTNYVFDGLAVYPHYYDPYAQFYYDRDRGYGYMDIRPLLNQSEIYTIVLVAESEYGDKRLQREIKIKVIADVN